MSEMEMSVYGVCDECMQCSYQNDIILLLLFYFLVFVCVNRISRESKNIYFNMLLLYMPLFYLIFFIVKRFQMFFSVVPTVYWNIHTFIQQQAQHNILYFDYKCISLSKCIWCMRMEMVIFANILFIYILLCVGHCQNRWRTIVLALFSVPRTQIVFGYIGYRHPTSFVHTHTHTQFHCLIVNIVPFDGIDVVTCRIFCC